MSKYWLTAKSPLRRRNAKELPTTAVPKYSDQLNPWMSIDSRTMTKRDLRTWSEDLGIFEM